LGNHFIQELFIAVAADRTRHIKLATGVISLPHYHPLIVANRMVQLDQMTHSRVMLGMGPAPYPGRCLYDGYRPYDLTGAHGRGAGDYPAAVYRDGTDHLQERLV
jgi:alkanesulfonate monooxygenase SsuD/methylene tetrahydromethanopterin reductase-like flavin-dependent oxidoreductase (luciferase family)